MFPNIEKYVILLQEAFDFFSRMMRICISLTLVHFYTAFPKNLFCQS